MLTHSHRARTRLHQVSDAGLFVVAAFGAYWLRAHLPWFDRPPLEEFTKYLWLLGFAGIIGPVALAAHGFYEQSPLATRMSVILLILRGCAVAIIAIVLLLFMFRVQLARSVVLAAGGMAALLIYAREELTRWSYRHHAQRRRVLWVGQPSENVRLRAALSGTEREAIETAGECDPASTTVAAFVDQLHDTAANAIVLSLVGVDRARAEAFIDACDREGVEVLVRPGLFQTSPYRLSVDDFAGEPVLHLRAQAAAPGQLFCKQVIDYLGAGVLVVATLPLTLVIALAVKLTSAGPILFQQQRAGLNGRPFVMFKFRTMRDGADREQASLQAQNPLRGPIFKLAADPRVTVVGRFLRRHSLDELPQLWNVLRGEMSLVGPRPLPLADAVKMAAGAERRRQSVRPGMTGLWQISGRSDIADFADWVRLDLTYIDQWSLWLDLKILVATLPVTLLGRGAR